MFKGLFDESRISKKDEACVVAGFAGTGDECDRVAEEWKAVVKPLGEFHGLEFFSRNPDGSMTGIYKHLNVEEAESCAIRLIDLLKASKLTPIGMAIATQVFMSLSEDERRYMTSAVLPRKSWKNEGAPNRPYFAPFHYCITSANEYTPDGETMYLTFDRQEQYEGAAKKIYNDLLQLGGKWSARLGRTIAFSDRHEAVLLQAADMLAYVLGENAIKGMVTDRTAKYASEHLVWEKDYVVAMSVRAIDAHLQKWPFRSTFWQGLTEPDFLEELRSQGVNVLACKAENGMYKTHHLRKERVKIVGELTSQPGSLNRTDTRDDSTQ